LIGMNFSRGGMELNGAGIGPTLASIRPPYGPTGAGVTGGEPLTRRDRMTQTQGAGASAAASSGQGTLPGSPVVVLAGFLGLAFLLWLFRKNSSYLQQNTLGFNTFNVLTIWIVATLGILLGKIVFNKFPVYGLTPVINAV
jgi:multisubunit Na+/H+ antiporter MnhF subunit